MIENREERLAELEKDLNSCWTLNWDRILAEAHFLALSSEERQKLAELFVGYIERAVQYGTFGNLEKIDPIMKFFDIDGLEFTQNWLETIMMYYRRFSLPFLYRMSPMLYNGKLVGGGKFEKKGYVREMLVKDGAEAEELTDEFIKTLWRVREILVRMHRQGKSAKCAEHQPLSMTKFIEYVTQDQD